MLNNKIHRNLAFVNLPNIQNKFSNYTVKEFNNLCISETNKFLDYLLSLPDEQYIDENDNKDYLVIVPQYTYFHNDISIFAANNYSVVKISDLKKDHVKIVTYNFEGEQACNNTVNALICKTYIKDILEILDSVLMNLKVFWKDSLFSKIITENMDILSTLKINKY